MSNKFLNEDDQQLLDDTKAVYDQYAVEKDEPKIEAGWIRAALYFIATILGSIVSGTLLIGIVLAMGYSMDDLASLMGGGDTPIHIFLIAQTLTMILTLLVTWLFMKYINRRPFVEIGFQWKGYQADAAIGFFLGVALISIGFGALILLGQIGIENITLDPVKLLMAFLLMVVVSVNEEVMVRGYIQKNLTDSFGKWWGLIVASIIFSILHGMNPNITAIPLINIMLAGLLLGIYYMHCNNLWFPIMLHLTWNFCQGPIYGFEVSGMDLNALITQKMLGDNVLLSGGEFGFEGSLLATGLIILSILGVHFYYQRKEELA